MIANVYIGNIATAGGTANAITASYVPAPTVLADKMLLYFRAIAANTTTTPTFSPNGLAAHTIVKHGGQPLAAGDIPSGGVMEVCYNEGLTQWELLNPRCEAFVGSYTTVQIAALVGMTLRQRVFNTTDNDYEWYDGTRWVKEAHPKYKVYRAIFSDDSATPSNTVFENNLGTITWASNSAGAITVTATGLLTSNKTIILFSPQYGTPFPDVILSYVYGLSVNGFNIATYDVPGGSVPIGGYLSNASIEIRVYY